MPDKREPRDRTPRQGASRHAVAASAPSDGAKPESEPMAEGTAPLGGSVRVRPSWLGQASARLRSAGGSMLWVKALYILVFSSYGFTGAYGMLYYRRVGLSNTEIGLLMGVQPLVMLVSGPAWSIVADRLGLRSRLLSLVLALGIVPMLSIMWTRSFVGLLTLVILHALLSGPVQPLMDSVTLASLGAERHRYGSIRAYGSLGYAPVAWMTGVLIQTYDIRWIYVGNAVVTALAAVVALRTRAEQRVVPTNIVRGLTHMVRQPGWLLFMVAFFVAMVLQGVAFGYSSLYLDTLGASEGLIGAAQAVGSLGQVVVLMHWLPSLLRRAGSERLMLIALAAYGLRVGVWGLWPVAEVVVVTQLLTGVTFGAAAIAAVDYAAKSAPAGMEVTSQALATGLISGLGRSAGSTVAGGMYDGLGPGPTFIAFGATGLLATAVFRVAWRKLRPPIAGP